MQFSLYDEGVTLDCVLERPSDLPEKQPLAVILHGFTGNKDERHLLAICQTLRDCGFATLRFDLYGHGKSGGTFRDHTISKWVSNAVAVIDYASGLDFVSELWLGGHSQGGLTAMLAGVERRERLAGLLLFSPACMIPEGARRGSLLGGVFDPKHIPDVICLGPERILDGNYLRSAQKIDIEAAIRDFDGPVLLIHATDDATVPIHWGEQTAAHYQNCTFVRIEDDTHCYDRHLDRVTDALRAYVQKPRHPDAP